MAFCLQLASLVEERVAKARELMSAFAERTGLDSARPQRRYLWTDAFAVCNFFALAKAGEPRFRALALELVDRVHHTLGRHRDDDPRSGWLSGLGEREGAERPTCAGLRIGKRLPERRPGEPLDERTEWDRDGQYFHYLTRWMHALDVATRVTGDRRYHRWSVDLAEAAFRGFVSNGDRLWMAWKMSIDLTRSLVPSTGQLDPIDGLITYSQIEATGRALRSTQGSLVGSIRAFASMLGERLLATSDPLGVGGLLAGAYRLVQIGAAASLVPALLDIAHAGLERFAGGPDLRRSAPRRLAFRELGLAVGLAAVDGMLADSDLVDWPLERLVRYLPLRDAVESFWLEPEHQQAASWRDHRDINAVMLATALLPSGYLALPAPL